MSEWMTVEMEVQEVNVYNRKECCDHTLLTNWFSSSLMRNSFYRSMKSRRGTYILFKEFNNSCLKGNIHRVIQIKLLQHLDQRERQVLLLVESPERNTLSRMVVLSSFTTERYCWYQWVHWLIIWWIWRERTWK